MEVVLKHKKVDYWSKVIKYKSCVDYISSYWTRSGSKYTGLTEEDEKRLEKILGYADGTLARHSKFWITFAVKLGEKPMILHTENPWDELQYLFLKSHKNVANGFTDNKPNTDYILVNKDSEAKEVNMINKNKREAMREFDKMSIEEMRKCLRIYGVKSDNISAELVESTLFDLIEKDPKKFFTKWVDNKTKNTEFLIEAAIAKNIIRKNKNIYHYGTEVIGNSMQDAIAHIDQPKNQDLKLSILDEIENK